jgi:type I restriction enzyme R subunit
MSAANVTYTLPDFQSSVLREDGIESGFIGKLQGLKYEYRLDITNRATLEKNFREKFKALITAKTQKHEALKAHKKGLMQKLFPAPGVDEP